MHVSKLKRISESELENPDPKRPESSGLFRISHGAWLIAPLAAFLVVCRENRKSAV